jgi:hypothetical protein
MSENLHNIDQYFKDELEGYQEAPSQAVWEALDNHLDKVETVKLRHKYKILKYWSVAITVILTSALVYLYNSKQSSTSGKPQEVVTEKTNYKNTTQPKQEASEATTSNAEQLKSANASINNDPNESNPTSNLNSKSVPKDEQQLTSNHQNSFNRFKRSNTLVNNVQKNGLVTNDLPIIYITQKDNSEKQNNATLLLYHSYPKKGSFTNLSGMKVLVNTQSLQHSTPSLAFKNPVHRKNIYAACVYYSKENAVQHLEEGRQEHDEDDKNRIMNGEEIQSSYSYGIMGSFTINSKISLQTGISYSHKVTNIADKQIFARRIEYRSQNELKYKFNCAAGYTYIDPKSVINLRAGDSIKVSGSSNQLSYVELPLLLNYQLGNGKVHLNFFGGISAHFLQKGTVQTSLISSWGNKTPITTELVGLKKTYFSGIAGAGLEVDLHKTLSLFAQEVLRSSLGSINKNAPTKTYATNTGLQLGVRLKL